VNVNSARGSDAAVALALLLLLLSILFTSGGADPNAAPLGRARKGRSGQRASLPASSSSWAKIRPGSRAVSPERQLAQARGATHLGGLYH